MLHKLLLALIAAVVIVSFAQRNVSHRKSTWIALRLAVKEAIGPILRRRYRLIAVNDFHESEYEYFADDVKLLVQYCLFWETVGDRAFFKDTFYSNPFECDDILQQLLIHRIDEMTKTDFLRHCVENLQVLLELLHSSEALKEFYAQMQSFNTSQPIIIESAHGNSSQENFHEIPTINGNLHGQFSTNGHQLNSYDIKYYADESSCIACSNDPERKKIFAQSAKNGKKTAQIKRWHFDPFSTESFVYNWTSSLGIMLVWMCMLCGGAAFCVRITPRSLFKRAISATTVELAQQGTNNLDERGFYLQRLLWNRCIEDADAEFYAQESNTDVSCFLSN